jgi:flagellar basal-body rod modification protein FlgD
MDSLSILNNQTIIASSAIDTSSAAEAARAAEDAESQRVNFLTLLLTQLANQNPLDPMDTDEFAAQLTRYSQLEQQIITNEKLTVTNSVLNDNASAASFAYIGQDVELDSKIGVVQNDEASWSYEVQGTASDVKLSVSTEDGSLIYEGDGSITNGVHDFTLDTSTLDLVAGQQLTLNVIAKNVDESVDTEVTSHVNVDGVWSDKTTNYLTAGAISFRSSDILKIQEPYNEATQTTQDN